MTYDDVSAQLREYLDDEIGIDLSSVGDDDKLLDGTLDSLEIVKLIGFIEKQLKIKIPPFRVSEESFASIRSITNLVLELNP